VEAVETSLVQASLPIATQRDAEGVADRIAPWVATGASVWFALAAAWGMFGPLPVGHYGTMGGEGIIGENMIHWHIWGPVWDYVTSQPPPSAYYCHHPWGGFWIQAVLSAIFGHHNFVLPLPAVLMSAATPPLLYGIGRDAWGKVAGAAAAVGFTFLPITLAFANFHNVEVTVLFACTLFFWGHVRMMTTGKTRYLVASVAGACLAACADWPAYVMLGTLLGVSLVRTFLLPTRWRPAFSLRRYGTWWALSVSVAIGCLAMWVYLFARSDKLLEWLGSATTRGLGAPVTLRQTLDARKSWIDISFTPPVIFLGKLAAPLALFRLLRRRRDEEAYSLSILAGATASYVLFKGAADVHIFWSQYFGGYFALAFAQLIATWQDILNWIRARLKATKIGYALGLVPIGLTILYSLAMFPDALRTLHYARETGGRFNENGTVLRSETNLIYLLYRLKARLPEATGPDVLPELMWLWPYGWASAGQGRGVASVPTEHTNALDPHPIFLARAISLSTDQQKTLASHFHVEIYDDEFWVVDRREPQAPPDAYSLEEREPSIWEWYFISGVEPIRKYVHDPFSTWEWRIHLGQPAAPPTTPPATREQVRIAHNVAVASGDEAAAQRLEADLGRDLVRAPATTFTQGLSLLGYRRIGGTEPRIVLLFRASEPVSDAWFAVRAKVEKKRAFSFIPPDPIERGVSVPVGLSTKLYRPGFIYSQTVVLRQRIGVERLWGAFQAREGTAPVPVDLRPEVQLLVLD
jgi:hypothetical protein